jgi:endonuclease YncB( thermonuclease family)
VVRLIGVLPPHGTGQDTYAAFFDEVTTPAVRNIIEGKRVRILRDKVGHDREGRPLVYIFTEDGSQLNATLIQKGFARVSLEVPFKLQDEFRLWEQEAKNVGIGLWGARALAPEKDR